MKDGDRTVARRFRDRLATLAATSVSARAFLAWADALLEQDIDVARAALAQTAKRFHALERPLDEGRCLVDLADVERTRGEDPRPTLARASAIFDGCGASILAAEANEALDLAASDEA